MWDLGYYKSVARTGGGVSALCRCVEHAPFVGTVVFVLNKLLSQKEKIAKNTPATIKSA